MLTKKIEKYIVLSLMASLLMLAYADAGAQNSWETVHNPARNLVWPHKLEREISFLSDSICTGRAMGTRGNIEAGAWVARKFRKTGLIKFGTSYGMSLIADNGTAGRNIVGLLPGSAKYHPTNYVIIGAHYDHLGTIDDRMFPGADANASGVVAMTSIAEMLAMTQMLGQSYPVNIIFVAFDGKEMDMAGSRALLKMIENGELVDPVNHQTITFNRIKMMVNLDQIGSSLSPLNNGREDYMIMLDGTSKWNIRKELLAYCNDVYGIGLDLDYTYYGSERFTRLFYGLSDHKVFSGKGMPAIMFTSGITMNNNKTWDRPDSLNMDILRKRIYLIYHWLLMTI